MILAEGNRSSASDQWCEDFFQGDKVAHNWSHIGWDWFSGKQVLGKDNWHTVWYRLTLFKTMYEQGWGFVCGIHWTFSLGKSLSNSNFSWHCLLDDMQRLFNLLGHIWFIVGLMSRDIQYYTCIAWDVGRHRWVEYADYKNYNASAVPPEWHGWLHYITDHTPEQVSVFLTHCL
jgi:hypothetical protein